MFLLGMAARPIRFSGIYQISAEQLILYHPQSVSLLGAAAFAHDLAQMFFHGLAPEAADLVNFYGLILSGLLFYGFVLHGFTL